ncbi:hypothetical protein [Campylobacter magnus]|uniref:hypothetical protein n=1 Tax=Campylobacter magnus TaxID=3026462 RepID=UPI00235EF900|nr:hypothetical protein [Campylobacter magnus]MDD0856544.1 hypothetical protein [Campylobacter magnus]
MDSPAPYKRAFTPFFCASRFLLVSGLLEKSAQNSLERYRYGAPRLVLRQNFKKSPHDLGA